MYRTDVPTAVQSLPAPSTPGTPGYFTGGEPGATAPTVVDADWLNTIQEELIAPVLAAGIAPSKATRSQVLAALKLMFSGVVGAMRNASMYVSAASATATFSADEIIVEQALGGLPFCLANYSEQINLASVGAGGMDTGSAPVSGYVALYAIYNLATATASILATNATSAAAPNVYAGAHMPAGYTASALIGVWPTNASGLFPIGYQNDRHISFPQQTAITTTVQVSSLTALSIAGVVPMNAKSINIVSNYVVTSATSAASYVAASSTAIGLQYNQAAINGGQLVQNCNLDLIERQKLYYIWNTTPVVNSTYNLYIVGYTF